MDVYCSLVRSILLSNMELLFLCICLRYLSSALERIQERAMPIIFPGVRYKVALARAGLATLEARQADACCKLSSLRVSSPGALSRDCSAII